METIPQNSLNGKSGGTKAPKGTGTTLSEEVIQQFYGPARQIVTKGDYLRRAWLPHYGHRFYSLIKVLRGHCSYQIKEGEAECYPSLDTIAKECKVSRRTICNWLARDDTGRFIHPQMGEALNLFLRIVAKHRYDPVGQRRVRAVSRYFVCMHDPLHPDDFEKMRELAISLALAHLEAQQAEQEREQRVRETEARASRPTSFGEQLCTPKVGQILHSQSSAKAAPDRPTLTAISNTDILRLGNEDEVVPAVTTRSSNTARQVEKDEKYERTEGYDNQTTKQAQQNRIEYRNQEGTGPRAARLSSSQADQQPPTPPSERDIAIDQAEEAAGGVVYSLLVDMGDTNAGVGTRIIIAAMVDAGAPLDKMIALAYLGRARLKRHQLRGGQPGNKPGYYISIMRNLAKEAKHKGWNTAKMEEQDQRNHARAIQMSQAQRQRGHQYQ